MREVPYEVIAKATTDRFLSPVRGCPTTELTMKKHLFAGMFVLLLPFAVVAGALDDLEEALIRQDPDAAITLIKRGLDVNTGSARAIRC